jgi:hypothetical protein
VNREDAEKIFEPGSHTKKKKAGEMQRCVARAFPRRLPLRVVSWIHLSADGLAWAGVAMAAGFAAGAKNPNLFPVSSVWIMRAGRG